MVAQECAESIEIRDLFPKYIESEQNEYKRNILNSEIIVKNGRADHVQKLIAKVK